MKDVVRTNSSHALFPRTAKTNLVCSFYSNDSAFSENMLLSFQDYFRYSLNSQHTPYFRFFDCLVDKPSLGALFSTNSTEINKLFSLSSNPSSLNEYFVSSDISTNVSCIKVFTKKMPVRKTQTYTVLTSPHAQKKTGKEQFGVLLPLRVDLCVSITSYRLNNTVYFADYLAWKKNHSNLTASLEKSLHSLSTGSKFFSRHLFWSSFFNSLKSDHFTSLSSFSQKPFLKDTFFIPERCKVLVQHLYR